MALVFTSGHVSCPICPATGQPLLLPTSQCHPFPGLPYGWLARHCTWRSDGFSTFPVVTLGQLRWSLNVGGSPIPCRHVSNLQPDHACKPKETCLRPINSRRSVARLTARKVLCLISPYCPSLALNRMELSDGSSCRHSDPIQYIVREASHPVISATVARSRRELVGIHQVPENMKLFPAHINTRHRVATNAPHKPRRQ